MSVSHFLVSRQLVGSLENHIHSVCTPTLLEKGKAIGLHQTADTRQACACAHTYAHTRAHAHTSDANPAGSNSMVICPKECWPWPPSACHPQGEGVASSLRKPCLHKAVAHRGSASSKYLGNTSRPCTTYHDHPPSRGGWSSPASNFKPWVWGFPGGKIQPISSQGPVTSGG